jgi:MFS family permease
MLPRPAPHKRSKTALRVHVGNTSEQLCAFQCHNRDFVVPLQTVALMTLVQKALLAPLIVACAMFMESVDANVIVTALPSMARDFGRDPVTLKIAVTSYVLGLGVFIPVCGWLADRFGARTVFRTAIGIFVGGSLLCAASSSLGTFTVARFIQGVGGAMMVPVGRIIIFRVVPKSEFIRAMNYLSVPAMLGPAAGPLLGGFITTYLHWRLIFFINVPVGILGIYLTNRHIVNTREPHPGPLDWIGFVLSAGGAALFLLGLSLLGGEMTSNSNAVGMCVCGAFLLAIYVPYALKVKLPLLDLRFFRIPTFQASVAGGSLFRIGLGALPFLLPLLLQEGLGRSAFESGLITCASAFGGMFMRHLRRVLSGDTYLAHLVCGAARRFLSGAAVHQPELADLRGNRKPRCRPRDEPRQRRAADVARPRRDDRRDRPADYACDARSFAYCVDGFLARISRSRTLLVCFHSGDAASAASCGRRDLAGQPRVTRITRYV